jgi:hypothetical protein
MFVAEACGDARQPPCHAGRRQRERQASRRCHKVPAREEEIPVIRKLKSGEYRIYSIKLDPKTRKRRNLGTFKSLAAAKKHERAIQYFKHH